MSFPGARMHCFPELLTANSNDESAQSDACVFLEQRQIALQVRGLEFQRKVLEGNVFLHKKMHM